MGALIVSLAGTPAGEALALALALLAALAHAIFGAVNKGGRDPWLNRGAINACYGAMAAPFALFVTPWPSPALWALLPGVWLIHLIYEALQARAYEIGGFTVVYPIARGAGPLIAALAAAALFGEALGPWQWAGLALLTASIWGLAAANFRAAPADLPRLRGAVFFALLTGVMVAAYTVYDAWAIRAAEDPFTFLAWFFTLGGLGFPFVALARWRRLAPEARPHPRELALRGLFGGLIAFLSFGAVMLALRLDKVGEAAALRETSIVFATAIGVLVFRERVDALRLALIGLIVAAALLIEFG